MEKESYHTARIKRLEDNIDELVAMLGKLRFISGTVILIQFLIILGLL